MPEAVAMTNDREKLLSQLSQKLTSGVMDQIETKMNSFFERKGLTGSMGELEQAIKGSQDKKEAWANPAAHGTSIAARAMMAKAAARFSRDSDAPVSASTIAEQNWPGDETVQKALVTTVDANRGGSLLREAYRDEITDELLPRVVLFDLGLRPTPMPEQTLTVPGITRNAMGFYKGETKAHRGTSTPETGARKLSSKTLITTYGVSNTYIRAAMAGQVTNRMVEALFRGALRRMQVTYDFFLLRGRGTDHSPKGITNWASQEAQFAGELSFENVLPFLGYLFSVLEEKSVDLSSVVSVIGPRLKNYLQYSCLDGLQRPFFLQMMLEGELLGYRYGCTSQVPSNLGENGNETEITVVALDHVIYGEGTSIEVTTSSEAPYTDDDGKMRSAMEDDVTVTRLLCQHDINVEHEEAVIVGTKIPISSWAPFPLVPRVAA